MQPSAIAGIAAALSIAAAPAPPVLAQGGGRAPPDLVSSSAGDLRVERLAALEYPWGMAPLPDGRLLVTEKPGRLRIWADGELSQPLSGVPEVVFRGSRQDQGGLLDVAIDPDFDSNRLVYLSYVEAAPQQPEALAQIDDYRFRGLDLSDDILRGGAIARGRLEGNALKDVEVIWRQVPKMVGRGHFGHRLVFAPDGTLFVTSGDRMRFMPAQSLDTNLGKVVRINTDGSPAADNPFTGRNGVGREIWSYGHRNMLAAAVDPAGRLWVLEMGPHGGDELNLVQRGRNYGWPLVSNGDHYDRDGVPTALTSIPGHPTEESYQAPVRSWTPVISPSGAVFHDGGLLPEWRGSLLAGGLSSQGLVRLALDGEEVRAEERIDMGRRIRDVAQGPDGAILLLVDAAEGGLLRLTPAGS